MPVITVPRPLREKLGEEASDALVNLLNEVSQSTRDEVVEIVSERFEARLREEFARLRAEIAELAAKLRQEMAESTSSLRQETAESVTSLRKEMADLETSLHREIASRYADTIRWMFVFWVGQVVVLGGLILALLRR